MIPKLLLQSARTSTLATFALPATAQCDWTQQFVGGPDSRAIIYGMDGNPAGEVFAIGSFHNGDWNPYGAIFDGTQWTEAPIDNAANDGFMNDVVVTDTRPLAVGYIAPGVTPARPLLLEWNGQMWERIDAPDSGGDAGFYAAGLAGSDVWIAGYRENPDIPPAASLIGWAGRRTGDGSFEMFDLPLLAKTGGRSRNDVQGISGSGPADVWAVGFGRQNGTSGFPDKVMIQHFNGSSWELLDTPTFGLQSALEDVKAIAPDNAWAVGFFLTQNSLTQPLVMQYDGTTWSQVQIPMPTGHTSLYDLAVVSPDEIYAVGTTQNQDQMQVPFILQYDGTSWSIVQDLNPSGISHWFRAAAVADGTPFAAGQFTPEPFIIDPFIMTLSCDECLPDVNGDELVSPADFTAWINAFNNNLPECDQNGDNACTPADFTAWIANFNAGC